jgi:hypothetical protein
VLKEEFALQLRERVYGDKPARYFDCAERAGDLQAGRPRRRKRKMEGESKKDETKKKRPRRVEKIKKCTCDLCSDASYDSNMSKSGPEKLYKTSMTLSQIFAALGIDCSDLLDQLCELSVASMDIESRTLEVSLVPPNTSGLGSEPCPSYVKKIQKPVMIAHQDALTDGVICFTAEDDTEEAIYSMMSRYWVRVLDCQLECARTKRELARPLYEILSRYEKALFDLGKQCFAEADVVEPSDDDDDDDERPSSPLVRGQYHSAGAQFTAESNLGKFWRTSLPGQAARQLDRLVMDYNIFSFYG